MPLSSLDAGLTTMRQGIYESYVGSDEVKLQFVNTFLYGSHSFCFPLCPSSSSTVYDSLNVILLFVNMDLENQKFINSSCDYSFSFNMNHCSLTAQQLSVNSYNKTV